MTTSATARTRNERIQAICRKHWLGLDTTPQQKAIVDEIRAQYFATASEYYKAAYSLYDHLHAHTEDPARVRPAFSLVNRNVQLFLGYSILWESFKHIYTAAAYTDFAQHGPARAPLEDERAQIHRVLAAPIMTDADFERISLLRSGETADGAITRMASRSSRELREFYGAAAAQHLTDMDDFLMGVVEVSEVQHPDGSWQAQDEHEKWTVQPLDDAGHPLDPEAPYGAEKYRSIVKWDCYQIRQNLNFVGKSESSIDDAILVMRAFCLLDPLVGALLQDNRKAMIFAL